MDEYENLAESEYNQLAGQFASQNSAKDFNRIENDIGLKRVLMETSGGYVNSDVIGSCFDKHEIVVEEALFLLVKMSLGLTKIKTQKNQQGQIIEVDSPENFDLRPLAQYYMDLATDYANLKKAENGRTADILITERHITEGKHTQYLERFNKKPKRKTGFFK